MKPTEIIELIYKVMPYPNLIKKLDMRNNAIYFQWDGYSFRVNNDLFVEEVEGSLLCSSSIATLVEHLLKTNRNYLEKAKMMCLKDKTKVCNLCHECDVSVLNPNY